jgi:hypothetical protein
MRHLSEFSNQQPSSDSAFLTIYESRRGCVEVASIPFDDEFMNMCVLTYPVLPQSSPDFMPRASP